jgi:hypothetical protein
MKRNAEYKTGAFFSPFDPNFDIDITILDLAAENMPEAQIL